MGLLAATIGLAIDLTRSAEELGAWWRQHQGALKMLDKDELALAVAAKDRRKAAFMVRASGS